jgi:hypothetical protein
MEAEAERVRCFSINRSSESGFLGHSALYLGKTFVIEQKNDERANVCSILFSLKIFLKNVFAKNRCSLMVNPRKINLGGDILETKKTFSIHLSILRLVKQNGWPATK